jgi:hypothetical protein
MKGADVSCIMEISGSYFSGCLWSNVSREPRCACGTRARSFGAECIVGSPVAVVKNRVLLDD